MTADNREEEAVAKSVGAGLGGANERHPRPKGKGNSTVRHACIWGAAGAVVYGLLLTVSSDSLVFLAIPGMLGLVVLVGIATQRTMLRSFPKASIPHATDKIDHRGVVRFHYTSLMKRYAILLLFAAASLLLPWVTTNTYLFPLIGVGIAILGLGTISWFDQIRRVRRCSRTLNVYHLEFRTPVEKIDIASSGKRTLLLGTEGRASTKMSAREVMGPRGWPSNIGEGVWFAGDEAFGGALVVPGSGEMMYLQPQDWAAYAGERSRAGAERVGKAERAGLDRNSM